MTLIKIHIRHARAWYIGSAYNSRLTARFIMLKESTLY